MEFSSNTKLAGRRAAATLIDYIIVFAFFIWFVYNFGEPNNEGGYTVHGFPAIVPVVFWFLWLVVAETLYSRTFGHFLLGLKVVSHDAREISFGQALKRRLCDAIEISWCFGLVAFIIVRSSGTAQRLGDIVGKTLIVDKNEIIEINFDFETGKLM